MVAYKETAEEQLLRMIEGPQPGSPSTASPGSPEPPRAPRGSPLTGFSQQVSGWLQRLSPSRARPRGRDPLIWNLQLASRVLWVILAVLGAYVVVDLVLIQPTYQLNRSGGPGGSASGPVSARTPLKPLADYIGAVIQRDPFTGLLPGMAQQASPPTTQRRLEEMAAGYVLVGIDRGPNPTALVENTEQKRTLIINVGDDIGGMKVKKITSEGVLLNYEGEEYLLR